MCKYWVFDTEKVLKANADKFVKEMLDDRLSNPDGSGFYFFNKKRNTCEVHKFYGITDDNIVESFLKKTIGSFTNGSLLIYHNRYSTSGEKTKSQAHPIPIDHCDEMGRNIFEGWYVIHNGILTDFEVTGMNNLSDTQIVARTLGQWMYDHNIKSPKELGEKRWKDYFEQLFAGSKVTICYRDEYYTINSDLGVVEDGVWKSGSTTVYGSYSWESRSNCEKLTDWEKNYLKMQGWSDEEIEEYGVEAYDNGIITYKDANGKTHYAERASIPDYDPNKKEGK